MKNLFYEWGLSVRCLMPVNQPSIHDHPRLYSLILLATVPQSFLWPVFTSLWALLRHPFSGWHWYQVGFCLGMLVMVPFCFALLLVAVITGLCPYLMTEAGDQFTKNLKAQVDAKADGGAPAAGGDQP